MKKYDNAFSFRFWCLALLVLMASLFVLSTTGPIGAKHNRSSSLLILRNADGKTKGLRFELPYQERLMRAGVDAGLPVEELARTVLDAVVADALYVLPGFSDAVSRTFAEAVGHGRATGSNPYPRFMLARAAGGPDFTPDGIG